MMAAVLLVLPNCSNDDDPIGNTSSRSRSTDTPEWLIPQDQVIDGGPGKDGIPAISDPQFALSRATEYLNDDDLVIGYKHGDEIRAYPHAILNWHEIINDQIENNAFALTYCPLTGTAINWNRTINGVTTTFGVSGLLYNTNLIPYDRETGSNWSQMLLKCVNGLHIGTEVSTFQVVETEWATWKELYPDSKMMTTETGYSRNYKAYPYLTLNGDYRKEEYLIFPVENSDDRLHAKERVLGVIEENRVRTYRFSEFDDGPGVITDFAGSVAVIGSAADNFMVAFKVEDEEISIHMDGEAIFKDQHENHYNIFGEVIAGPDIGKRLSPTLSFMGFWFSWAAFYPEVEIYNFTQ